MVAAAPTALSLFRSIAGTAPWLAWAIVVAESIADVLAAAGFENGVKDPPPD